MNSYLAVKAAPSSALLWTLGLMFWVAATGSARSSEPAEQIAPDVLLADGCPYPPGKPAAQEANEQGANEAAPELEQLIPELLIVPRNPVRPAVFYEDYVEADNPKIRI